MTYYVLVDADSNDAFFIANDDSVPKSFERETDAVESAKEYSGYRLILKVVGSVIEKTTHRYEKVK